MMLRLVALIWLALSLAFASGPAIAAAADCPMKASSSSSSSMTHHDGGDCCKDACALNCATACPAVAVPSIGRTVAAAKPIGKRLVAAVAVPLQSTAPGGADPPPRTTFS